MINIQFRRAYCRLMVMFNLGILLAPGVSAQVEQFSLAQCAQLDAALELNRDQLRRGFRLKQEFKLKAQQTQLELQLQYHCQQPQDQQKPEGKTRQRNVSKAAPASFMPRRRLSRLPATADNNSDDTNPKHGSWSTSASASQKNRSQRATQPVRFSLIAVKAPYRGAQLTAWLQFYQPPFYCFGVRQTTRIRQCVEQRQQAQQHFEQQYSAKASPAQH